MSYSSLFSSVDSIFVIDYTMQAILSNNTDIIGIECETFLHYFGFNVISLISGKHNYV